MCLTALEIFKELPICFLKEAAESASKIPFKSFLNTLDQPYKNSKKPTYKKKTFFFQKTKSTETTSNRHMYKISLDFFNLKTTRKTHSLAK
jgi:hypothetical protein